MKAKVNIIDFMTKNGALADLGKRNDVINAVLSGRIVATVELRSNTRSDNPLRDYLSGSGSPSMVSILVSQRHKQALEDWQMGLPPDSDTIREIRVSPDTAISVVEVSSELVACVAAASVDRHVPVHGSSDFLQVSEPGNNNIDKDQGSESTRNAVARLFKEGNFHVNQKNAAAKSIANTLKKSESYIRKILQKI